MKLSQLLRNHVATIITYVQKLTTKLDRKRIKNTRTYHIDVKPAEVIAYQRAP